MFDIPPSVPRVSMDDHRDADGNLDWDSYSKAEIENGQKCWKCGKPLIFPKGHQDWCYQCKSGAEKPKEELMHDSLIRCPKCGLSFDPRNTEQYRLFEEGEHEVWCEHCDHTFEVSTLVIYSFTSPPMLDEPAEEPEDDEDL